MRHNINMPKTAVIAAILLLNLFILDRQLLSWGLFNLFTDERFSRDGLDRVESFDPDRDILYLPPLDGKDMFAAIRDLSICRRKDVRRHIYLYLTSKREYLLRAIAQSYRYEETIREAFRSSPDVPEEIACLPMLESCFNPYAVSRSGAVGLWQFVDNTSRPLGLRADHWIDERRSVEKSTGAALRHLRNIRGCFPDWELTLAAYNGGAGYVKRAMESSGQRDFWKLREAGLLKEETSEYVPKFIALVLIHRNQRLFGVHDEIQALEKEDVGYFPLRRSVNLRAVARIAGVPVGKIRELNPELSRNITPPGASPYRLLLPSRGIRQLQARETELYRESVARVVEHRVRQGETVSSIARAYKKKLK